MLRVLACFFALLIISHQVSAVEMGIVTGSKTGTYYQIAKNIRALVSRHGINLTIYPAKGSLDNIADVYETPGVQLGIAQSDVLSYIDSLATDDNRIKQVAKKVKMVFPLYDEEVHLVANKQITLFSDLEGKVVAIGKEGSGSYLTANLLFQLAEITPAKRAEIGGKEAIKALLDGDIDAMFYVAGYPVKLFQDTATDGKLHLVPITHKSITEFYPISSIPGFTYSWQSETVSSIAVKAVLITYDYKWHHCKNIGNLAKIMYNNLGWLRQHGHDKWKNVDFDFQLRKWDQSVCVKKQFGDAPEELQTSPHRMGDILIRGLKEQFK